LLQARGQDFGFSGSHQYSHQSLPSTSSRRHTQQERTVKDDTNVRLAWTGGRIKRYIVRHGSEASFGEYPSRCPTRQCMPHSTLPLSTNLRQLCRMQRERYCSSSIAIELSGISTGLEAVSCNAEDTAVFADSSFEGSSSSRRSFSSPPPHDGEQQSGETTRNLEGDM
jgi:hypothetical protein